MKKRNLEYEITRAAEKLFIEKGFDATSTTDITNLAGCNQALVNYYFRSKEKLFQTIFSKKVERVLSFMTLAECSDITLSDFIRKFINAYFKELEANKKIPFFFINELVINKKRRSFIREEIILSDKYLNFYSAFTTLVKKEIDKGAIRQIDASDLLLHIISLTVFTFISLPLYKDFFLKDAAAEKNYINSRKEEIITMIINGIRK